MNDGLNSKFLKEEKILGIGEIVPEITMFNLLLRSILKGEDYSDLVELLGKVRKQNSGDSILH